MNVYMYTERGCVMSLSKQVKIHSNSCYDFISSLVRIQNNDGFTPLKSPNKDIRDWADKAVNHFPEDLRSMMAIFFNQETTYAMSLGGYIASWDPETITDFLKRLESVPGTDLLVRFLYTGIGPGKDITPETIGQLIANDKEAVSFINEHLSFSVEEKWQVLQLIMNPEQMKSDLLRLLTWFYKEAYSQIEQDIEKHIQGPQQELRDKVAKYGEEYLKLLIPVDYSKQKDLSITIAISYFWETGQTINLLDNVYVFGYRFFEQVEGKHAVLAGVQVFKTLADETRLNIIRLLAQRPWYGHELAQKLNVSNSTISHHMTLLIMNGLVQTYRDENRVYFQLVADEFLKVISSTINTLLSEG